MTDKLKALIAAYEATGRIAFVYPRKKMISLNGGKALSYEQAASRMQEHMAQG